MAGPDDDVVYPSAPLSTVTEGVIEVGLAFALELVAVKPYLPALNGPLVVAVGESLEKSIRSTLVLPLAIPPKYP